MAGQQDVDELFELRNSFYIGNYQACINEAQRIQPNSSDLRLERDVFLYRALLGQRKFGVVLSEIKPAASPQLQALKLLARYLQSSSNKTAIINELESELAKSIDLTLPTLLIVAATIYCYEGNYEAALRALNQSESLECRAMMVQTFLKMERLDQAKKELKKLMEKDEDSTLSQMAQAWCHICSYGDKIQEAYYIYQELIDKNTATPTLLNGQAVCFIGQGKHEEAESALQEAFDKDPNNSDTIINMMVLSHHMSKPHEVASRYLAQLKDQHKDLSIIQDILSKEEEFDRITKIFAC